MTGIHDTTRHAPRRRRSTPAEADRRAAFARPAEDGFALIVAMFMVLVLSVLGSSLVFVSQTETLSSLNYKTLSQVRYGAESGIHSAANHILWTYVPPGTAADPIAAYDITVSPVRFNGNPVVLSSDPDVASNYPVQAVTNAFVAASQGTMTLNNSQVVYNARATLLAMRQIIDAFTNQPVTLQTWEITGTGTVAGAGAAETEVSAIIERQETPVFKYAAFATDNDCEALKFGGGATTNSYDSAQFAASGQATPTIDDYGGNVGTNGNLTELGNNTVIHGSLSTPRSGVGNCAANNVTALTQSGGATVDDGLIELPQPVTFPTPAAPNPAPPTGNQNFNGGCPAGTGAFCTTVAGHPRIDPAATGGTVTLADVRVQGGTKLYLKAGTYIVNSLSFSGNSEIVLDGPGPVIFQIAGVGVNTPLDLTGGAVANPTYDPSMMQFVYAGTGGFKLTGGASSAALLYAPNATGSFGGGNDFYGAVIAKEITDMGGASIHYDRKLQTVALTAGNPLMGSFSWKSY